MIKNFSFKVFSEQLIPDSEHPLELTFFNRTLDKSAPLHKHSHFEILYVVSGNAFLELDGESCPAHKGDLFFLNSDALHVFRHDNQEISPFSFYVLSFSHDILTRLLNSSETPGMPTDSFIVHSLLDFKTSPEPLLKFTKEYHSVICDLFDKIHFEYHQQKKGYTESIHAYMTLLIVSVFRNLDESSQKNSDKKNIRIVNYINDYILNNYASRISIRELAKRTYINADHLGRIFRKHTGMSISKTIQKVRLEKACSLLSGTDSTIQDIAKACGFEDLKFFYKLFKDYKGLTPKAYRKTVKYNSKL